MTIRIMMRNNSDARRADVLADVRSAEARHNGGKLVIVSLDAADEDEARAILDASHGVASYEVRS